MALLNLSPRAAIRNGWVRMILLAQLLLAATAVASVPPGYYNRTFGLSGEALQMALHETIRDHTAQPYTWAYQFDAWDALQVLDRDPASPNNVLLVFSGASVPGGDINGGSNSNITKDSWEREHLWPRSYGVGQDGADFSDLFNLRPINQEVNSDRSNRVFAEPFASHPTDPAVPPPGAPECLWDPNGGQGRLWAPRPVERGDIARSMFYMAVRYDGRDEATMNLNVGDDPATAAGRFGRLSTLLQWHEEHAVVDLERRRNDLIFDDYQGNRNPFVDHPDLVARVFGDAPPPRAVSLTLSRDSAALDDGPAAVMGIVTLSDPAESETVVTLGTDGSYAGVSVPASVTIGSGQRSSAFTVDAQALTPPSFGEFRQDWVLTAAADSYGTSDAALTILGSEGRGWETFDRLLVYGSAYRDGQFVGRGEVRWSYIHATAQQDFPIDGRGILLRNSAGESSLRSGPISGGLGRLAIDLRKAFTGTGSRRVEVLVNGISRGFSPWFGGTGGRDDTMLTYPIDDINVEGDFTLEIRNASGGQLVVDNVRWTGYPAAHAPQPRLEAVPGRVAVAGVVAGEGPSTTFIFRLLGMELGPASQVLLAAPEEFELSAGDSVWGDGLTLETLEGGAVDAFVRVRLKEGLDAGDYTGFLSASAGADAVKVPIAGQVSAGAEETTARILPVGYRQDFGDFLGEGLLPEGWRVEADGTATNRYDHSAWATTSTGIKHGSGSDPLLGYQHTSGTGNVRLLAELENATGEPIRALGITYTGRMARPTEGRSPAFTVSVNGRIVPELAYSTAEGNGVERSARFGGLEIAPGARVEISWLSDRGGPSGASKQIGVSDFHLTLPEPPIVTLLGEAEMQLETGAAFTDPGAAASDPHDGPLNVTLHGAVNTSTPGAYTLSYGAINSVGLSAAPVTRTVMVLHPLDYFLQVTHELEGAEAEVWADPAGDGLSNLLTFALGGEPRAADRSILPVAVPLEEGLGLLFRLGREMWWDADSATLYGGGIRLSVEQSIDLVNWTVPPVDLTSPSGIGDADTVAAGTEILLTAGEAPAAPGGRVFLRLRVVAEFAQ